MKYLLIGLMIFSSCSGTFARGSSTTIQIIIDDSGVLVDSENADKYKLILLGHLKQLTRKREFATAHIDVISTSIGRTVWSGAVSDLKRRPERALALIESIKTKQESCNNLPAAFNELKSNLTALKRQSFTKAHVLVFSSLIHTPRPCDKTTKIVLPQVPPVKGNINGALASSKIVRSINFYWVSPHQKNVWEEFLTPTYVWALKGGANMTFKDIERSKFALEKGLELEAYK